MNKRQITLYFIFFMLWGHHVWKSFEDLDKKSFNPQKIFILLTWLLYPPALVMLSLLERMATEPVEVVRR